MNDRIRLIDCRDGQTREAFSAESAGPGFIGGYISSSTGTSGFVAAPGVLVLLKDYFNTVVAFTYTDVAGNYSFSIQESQCRTGLVLFLAWTFAAMAVMSSRLLQPTRTEKPTSGK